MSDPVMVDLDRYLLAEEEAENEYERREMELYLERERDVMRILNSQFETAEKTRRLINLIEYAVQEARDEGY